MAIALRVRASRAWTTNLALGREVSLRQKCFRCRSVGMQERSAAFDCDGKTGRHREAVGSVSNRIGEQLGPRQATESLMQTTPCLDTSRYCDRERATLGHERIGRRARAHAAAVLPRPPGRSRSDHLVLAIRHRKLGRRDRHPDRTYMASPRTAPHSSRWPRQPRFHQHAVCAVPTSVAR